MVVRGAQAFFDGLDAELEEFDKSVSRLLKRIVMEVHASLTSKTPVHTGQTVRNYIWTEGSEYSGPALDAIGSGFIGITSQMPLGAEPRRAANEDAVLQTMKALDFDNPYKKYFVTNKSPAVGGLERGELPGRGKPSRSPNGMFLITETAINSKLRSGIIS